MHKRVEKIIHQLQIDFIREKNIHEISGGEKQKVAIASVLVQRPKVLILDEPTSQLDPVSADELLSFITQLKNDLGLTVIISEHRLERLLPYTDKIIHLIEDGKTVYGPPRNVLKVMEQVPPIIQIARKLDISPLPLTIDDFPKIEKPHKTVQGVVSSRDTDAQPTLEGINLSTSFGENKILNDVNLQLYKGEILTLVGLNGAGKTTLLRSILGLTPSRGQRSLHGADMEEMALSEVIQHVAYLPQNPNDLLFAESVEEELKITLKNHNLNVYTSQIDDFLELFQLVSMKKRYPRDLSVGERQRTALAAITIHQPEIILLDEPTRGLDYQAKRSLSKILQQWRGDNRAILLVTQDVEFAAEVSDRAAILEEGNFRFVGAPQIAFSKFPAYRTQTSRLFPDYGWIVPKDVC
jgi:energy-coupling factor transport system ATP-binding protein